tara:strand:+ start:711 stop:842 length:132 start_codon:yes stop_codon:yes gene_type:complete
MKPLATRLPANSISSFPAIKRPSGNASPLPFHRIESFGSSSPA